MIDKNLIYIACPYTHADPSVRQARFDIATKVAAFFLRDGYNAFSPITHSHNIAQYLRTDLGFWKEIDEHFLLLCKSMVVLCLQGWETSVGVKSEIEIAEKNNIHIRYFSELDIKNFCIEVELCPCCPCKNIKACVEAAYKNGNAIGAATRRAIRRIEDAKKINYNT